jgi:hypothetical protein
MPPNDFRELARPGTVRRINTLPLSTRDFGRGLNIATIALD